MFEVVHMLQTHKTQKLHIHDLSKIYIKKCLGHNL